MADSKRGFAVLTPERRREISRQGGKRSQSTGRGHRWDAKEGKAANEKGLAVRQEKREKIACH